MNWDGLLIGIATFLIIGLFHPVVVKAEYYWGTRGWWVFLLLGLVGVVASLLLESLFWASLCGVFAFSSFIMIWFVRLIETNNNYKQWKKEKRFISAWRT